METVKEDDSPPDDEGKIPISENQDTLSMGAFSEESENQAVREELMKLVDIVAETSRDTDECQKNGDPSGVGTHKHVHAHVVIQETRNEIKDLTTENKVLQRRLLALQKRRSTIGTKLFLEGAETQYQIALKAWMDAKEELDGVMSEYDNKIDRMQEIVREKQQHAGELHRTFSAYKWEVARDARHIMSGKMLSKKLLDEMDTDLLESLEMELNKERKELQLIKIICEKLTTKRERIQMTVNVRTLSLLDDMEVCRDEAKFSERKLRELKHQYDALVEHIQKMQSKVYQEMVPCCMESANLQPAHHNNRSLRWGVSNQIHPRKAVI